MTTSRAGFLASMAAHAALIALLLWPSQRRAAEPEPGSPPGPATVRIYGTARPTGRPDAIPRPPAAARPTPKVRVNVVEAAPAPPAPSEPAAEEAASSDSEDSPEAAGLAEPGPGPGPGPAGDGPGGGGDGPQAAGSAPAGPVAFSAEMTPPHVLSGPDPRYTPQALEHEIEGVMLVRCI